MRQYSCKYKLIGFVYKLSYFSKIRILIIIYACLSVSSFAQTKTIDSLKKGLPATKDTQRVNVLNEISRLYFNQKQYVNDSNLIISAKDFAGQALQLSKEINYTQGIGVALFNTGKVLSDKRDLPHAISKFKQAMPYLKEAAGNKMLGDCLASLADCIHELGDNQQAIVYYDSSLNAFQKINDTADIIGNLEWKGHSYFDLGDYKNAYKYGQDAAELAQKTRDTLAQIQTASHLANLFLGVGLPETALEYMRIITHFYPNIFKSKEISSWETQWGLLKAGEAYLQLRDNDSAMRVAQIVGFGFGDHDQDLFLGHLYSATHEYSKALPYYTEGLQISEQSGHKITLARHANELCRVELALKNYKSALYYANKALLAAQSIHALLEMKNAVGNLADIYDKIKNYTKAYHFTQLYKSLSDSLAPEEYKRKLSLIQIRQQVENQKQQGKLLAKENQIQLQQNIFEKDQAKKIQIIAIIVIAASVLIVTFVMINIRLKRKKDQLQKKQLQQKLELQAAESKRLEADFTIRSMELEMQALRAQMNPHFIFNCLSSINRFILINKIDEASDYLTKFSRLIRMALHNSAKPLITLENELEALCLYLDLERLRFKNAFNYSITFINTIDVNAVYIPPMLIQPFAENAIWHGLMHKKGTGSLEIQLCAEDKTLTCVIMDNGIGRNMARSLKSRSVEKNKSMGVNITVGRLALLNKSKGEDSVFNIEDLTDANGNGCGTKVILSMPYSELTEVVA